MRRVNMKNFRVQIHYEGYRAETDVMAEDSITGIEKSILDKLGEKTIKWESTGMYAPLNRITYEEVVSVTRPVQTKTVLGVEVAV